jgi:hypothetical protein
MHTVRDLLLTRLWRTLALGALAWCLSGCAHSTLSDPARLGPFYQPRNHSGDVVLPNNLRRVLLLPVYGGSVTEPESSLALDEVVRTALQRQARFEVVFLPREDCLRRFGSAEFSSTAALPHGLLQTLRESYACDAVMFIDITGYKPYRPQILGFRAKLAMVDDLRLVWSFDEIVSAESPEVVNGVRRFYYRTDSHSGPPMDMSATALQSPGRYAAYVADAMFQTLPPR